MRVCVFAGAGGTSSLVVDAESIGAALAATGAYVVYGGSNKGVMGGLARGVLGADGHLTGVLPAKLAALKHYPPSVSVLEVTPDMPTRKAHFWECDAFLCLPGGAGTLDELAEIWCLQKLGYTTPKPIVIYNGAGFWDALKLLVQDMVRHGMMPQERADMLTFVDRIDQVVPALMAKQPEAQPAHEAIG